MEEESVILLMDTWAEQIREAAVEAREAHGDAITVEEWESGMSSLKNQICSS
ncbi:MAG: hypothetical protein ACPG49_11325 [Chitinophagales bacterium]